MPYVLGVAIGNGSTTAALSWRHRDGWSEVEPAPLGTRSVAVPTVLHLTPDGPVAGVTADGGVAGFLPRIGDDLPLVLDGWRHPAPALTAELAGWVVDRVVADQGGPPERTVFVVPGSWGPYRRGLLDDALWQVGLDDVTLLAEPVAAASGYLATGPVEVGGVLAVYSHGATSGECSVLRRSEGAGFELLACAELGEGLGGADLDDLLVDWARAKLDPAVRPDPALLRERCRAAKEELSLSGVASIEIDESVDVPLSRADFEELIRPVVDSAVGTLVRTVEAAGVTPDGVLLIGGTARIPLVRKVIQAALPDRPATWVDPATGAVHAAQALVSSADAGPVDVPPAGAGPVDARPPLRPTRPPVVITPLESPPRRSARHVAREIKVGTGMVVVGLVLVLIAVGILFTVLSGLDSGTRPGV